MFIKCAKIVLARNSKLFVLVYVFLLAILSFAFDYIEVPQTYFSNENNFLNIYLFKPAFNYTVVGLLIFVLVTLTRHDLRHLQNLLMPYTRLLVSWLLFTIVKQLIEVLAVLYGECNGNPEYNNQQLACTLEGYTWVNFRISGHAFYLLYAMLLILEEATAFDRWESKLRKWKAVVHAENLVHHENYTESSTDFLHAIATNHRRAYRIFKRSASVVKTAYMLLAVWMVLLHFNMFCTIVYFHAPIQKVLGALLAVGLWLVIYGVIFKLDLGFDDDILSEFDESFYLIPAMSTSSLGSEERLLSFSKDTQRDDVKKHLYIRQPAVYKYSV